MLFIEYDVGDDGMIEVVGLMGLLGSLETRHLGPKVAPDNEPRYAAAAGPDPPDMGEMMMMRSRSLSAKRSTLVGEYRPHRCIRSLRPLRRRSDPERRSTPRQARANAMAGLSALPNTTLSPSLRRVAQSQRLSTASQDSPSRQDHLSSTRPAMWVHSARAIRRPGKRRKEAHRAAPHAQAPRQLGKSPRAARDFAA